MKNLWTDGSLRHNAFATTHLYYEYSSLTDGYTKLADLLGISLENLEYNLTDRDRVVLKALSGKNSYTVYKMLKARKNNVEGK